MEKSTNIEKIAMIVLSCIGLLGIVFLEFYFIETSLFDQFPHIGIGFHLFGGFFVGIICYYLFLNTLIRIDWHLVMIFIIGTVGLAAVSWEGFEWVLGRITGSFYQASVDNTMADLFVGLGGGLMACPIILFRNIRFSKINTFAGMAS
ncbi:MAG: hypothetical protein H7259_01520 [Cytophagales bacterium]|nr:hypothetical protein [Cytophaga sp.]